MTIEEAKDQAAISVGYKNYQDAFDSYGFGKYSASKLGDIAMQIYADAKVKEAISLDDAKVKYYEDKIEMMSRTCVENEKAAYNQAIRDAADSAEADLFLNIPYVEKQSILKLLK